jgi:SpoVK/Ycf46/Vps4 family AAA+-type ATPase
VLFTKLLSQQKHSLTASDLNRLVQATEGYSASDLNALARDAAYGPIRDLGSVAAVVSVSASALKPITFQHFESAMKNVKPTVPPERMKQYTAWAAQQDKNSKS